jgi:cystinosin
MITSEEEFLTSSQTSLLDADHENIVNDTIISTRLGFKNEKFQLFLSGASLVCSGTILGLVFPSNSSLPSPMYRLVSNVIGYTYFIAWSISFYPQVLSNYKRGTTKGLSPDFCILNVIGFACYSTYNICIFYSKAIQEEYKERHGGSKPTVQSNDVAFAVHAMLLSFVTMIQIVYLNGIKAAHPSTLVALLVVTIFCSIIVYIALILYFGKSSWLDFLYYLSYIKIFISLVKYIPQVILNQSRKSTLGWSITNILLDFSGGVLSVLQLTLDCADMGDWTGITGNVAKLALGNVSIGFDLIFIWQHYILYPRQLEPYESTIIQNLLLEEHMDPNQCINENQSSGSYHSLGYQ